MAQVIFITGIGTDVGKTLVSAIIAEALQADYWKPVQAGFDMGTDTEWVGSMLSNSVSRVHPEVYKLKLAASPHIAANQEGITIELSKIKNACNDLLQAGIRLVVEGAGGLLVPLNEGEFVADLIRQLNGKVVLVSRNYLGSINHSLLTAEVCKQYKLEVLGWVFNDEYMSYEDDIVHWSGFPKIGSIPAVETVDKQFILAKAAEIKANLNKLL